MSHSPEDYLKRFDPFRNNEGRISETPCDYAARMRADLLPHWPKEVLNEWLYRHNLCADRYTFLGFENLSFRDEMRPLNSIPGQEG